MTTTQADLDALVADAVDLLTAVRGLQSLFPDQALFASTTAFKAALARATALKASLEAAEAGYTPP
jgi:hypothetical protein